MIEHLDGAVWESNIKNGDDGDVIIIVGNESVSDDADWREYWSIFEWRADRFQMVELDWIL